MAYLGPAVHNAVSGLVAYLGPAVPNTVLGSRVGRLALSGSGEQWPGQRDEDTTSGLIFKQLFRERRWVCL